MLRTSRDVEKKVSKSKVIPVWYYWEGASSPTVELCIQNWRTVLGQSKYTFEVRKVDHKSAKLWLDAKRIPCMRQKNSEFSALKSDFIRLALLEKYGGLYLDASIIMAVSPDWMVKQIEKGWTFQAFFNPNNMLYGDAFPVVETSMLFAAKPNHPFIKVWLKCMLDLKCTHRGRIRWLDKNIKDKGVRMQANLEYEYHMVYNALQMVFEKIKPFNNFRGVKLYSTTEYKYFTWENYDIEALYKNDFKAAKASQYPKYFLKLISRDRSELDYAIEHGIMNRNSWIGIMLWQNGSVHKAMHYTAPQKHRPYLLKCQRAPAQRNDLFKSYLDCLPCKGDACNLQKKRK